MIRSSVICLPTTRCRVPMDEGCIQPLSSDPKIELEYNGSSLYLTISRLCGISISWSLSRLTQVITIKTEVREGVEYTHMSRTQQQHTHKCKEQSQQQSDRVMTEKSAQISLKHFEGVVAKFQSCSVLLECLVYCSMRLGVPFIAPRHLGAIGDQIGRQFLPSVGWRTRQSGARYPS